MPTIHKRISKITKKASYQAKVRVKGFPPVTASFDRKSDADKWAQRIEAEMYQNKHFPSNFARKHTVSDLLGYYLANLQIKNPRRYKTVKPLLEWWQKEIGNTVLFNCDAQVLLSAQQKLMRRQTRAKNLDGTPCTITPATANRYMAALHTAFQYGVKPLKWIQENPVDDLEKFDEPNGRTRFLQEPEIIKLLDVCRNSKSEHLFALVLLGVATGARRREIQFIKWSDVNPDATLVTLYKTKNGAIRPLHLTGAASKMIQMMMRTKSPEQVYLFPSPNNPGKPVNFEWAWQNALRRAGIQDFRFHDLRHTCGSHLAMNGASAVEIADALGHKTLQMASRYAHLTQSHTSNVISKMTAKVLGHVEI